MWLERVFNNCTWRIFFFFHPSNYVLSPSFFCQLFIECGRHCGYKTKYKDNFECILPDFTDM